MKNICLFQMSTMSREAHHMCLRKCQAFLLQNMIVRDVLDYMVPFLTEDEIEMIQITKGNREQMRVFVQVCSVNDNCECLIRF